MNSIRSIRKRGQKKQSLTIFKSRRGVFIPRGTRIHVFADEADMDSWVEIPRAS